MKIKKLSILIPAYNEQSTIHLILNKVKEVELINNIQKEIIIVNDSSTDKTMEVLQDYISANKTLDIRLYNQPKNKGKGAAIHKAIETALEVYHNRMQKISTSKLNEIMLEAIQKNPPPSTAKSSELSVETILP